MEPAKDNYDFSNTKGIMVSNGEIIEEIERNHKSSRATHLDMWKQLAGMPPEVAEKSMKLFAEEVMPHFNN